MEVQVFGTRNSADTRKALRFFSERRVRTHFVDLKQKAASKGELRRFVERIGPDTLIDRESKRFLALGLQAAHYGPDRWLEILADEPALLVVPLVRWKHHLSVGPAPETWKSWLEEDGSI